MSTGVLASDERPVGAEARDRLVLVHGFTQTRRSWDAVRDTLTGDFDTVAVDAPGHGGSSGERLDLVAGAAAIGSTGGEATYIGYSMGGRFALRLAVDRPDLVRRLVLVSSTAGISDTAERAARRAADERLATDLERDGVEAFLERWLARPLFAGLPAEAAQLGERSSNTVAGLASSLRLAGTGAHEPLWDRLGELALPVLLVVGADDAKFVGIAECMTAAIPRAELAVVPGAGHTVHLEQPAQFVETLRTWLDATEPRRSVG